MYGTFFEGDVYFQNRGKKGRMGEDCDLTNNSVNTWRASVNIKNCAICIYL